MMQRRGFIAGGTCLLLAQFSAMAQTSKVKREQGYFMPEEGAPHKQTWMGFVASEYIWSPRQIPGVQADLAKIARTIAQYEPVSLVVNTPDMEKAQQMCRPQDQPYPIELVDCPLDDLWLRDTAPIFVQTASGEKRALGFNFNGWGGKQEHSKDRLLAARIAERAGVPFESSWLTLEGGGFEVDGAGMLMLTESCILNDNRNPGYSRFAVETELRRTLGVHKIIWLTGVKGQDITDGHIDFYARFADSQQLVLARDTDPHSFDYRITRENIKVLSGNSTVDGKDFILHVLDHPQTFNTTYGTSAFAAGYVGYYLCNGAVIAQAFGDRHADMQARSTLERLYPDRVVEQIRIDAIASGGGSIHCATQQEIL